MISKARMMLPSRGNATASVQDRQAADGFGDPQTATRIRDRAIRRAGELLKQVDGRGGDKSKSVHAHTSAKTQNEVARETGIAADTRFKRKDAADQ
jgi:hypothetical protein